MKRKISENKSININNLNNSIINNTMYQEDLDIVPTASKKLNQGKN